MVNYDESFIREVEKGIAAADRGEFVDHQGSQKAHHLLVTSRIVHL
jgi:predicted transcriptional regulator